jgi:hypothetical protein
MDGLNEFLNKYLQSPDGVVKLALGSSLFPGVVLTLFMVYMFVSSWLGFARSAAAKSKRAIGESKRLVGRLTRAPAGRVLAGVVLTGLVALLAAAWLGAAVVVGNILQYAYYTSPGGERNLFELPTSEVLYRVDLLGYSSFSAVYVPVLLVLLLLKLVRPYALDRLGFWIACLPFVPLVVTTGFVVFVELVLDVFLQGAPMSKYPALGWQTAFLGVAAIFALASMAAFSATAGLRWQWSQLLTSAHGHIHEQ